MAFSSGVKRLLIRATLITTIALWCDSGVTSQAALYVEGTWKGDSICVGDRPACKNEVIVYRFEAVTGKPGLVTLLADKIIDGKRVPMYKMDFQYDDAKGTLLCEFARGQTHGVWQYRTTADSMEGTLLLLPDKSIVRRVKVTRVNQDQVPAAPDLKAYRDS